MIIVIIILIVVIIVIVVVVNDNNDNDFIKHSSLLKRDMLFGYKYKSFISINKSLEGYLLILQFRFV